MEQKPSIVDKWKSFSLGALLGFLVFFIYLDKVHQDISFLAAKQAMVDLVPFKLLNPSTSVIKPNMSSDVFLNDIDKSTKKVGKKCNMFDGRWVYKPKESRSSYDSIKCPFVEEKMSCQENGRPESEYEKWIWEARDCDIPTFNGTDMLERLRNKRMILAGDSLNRNMWESLACLLFTSIPSNAAQVKEIKGYQKLWKAKDYNFTLEFYWSPFLVELNSKHESGKKVLVLDKLSSDSEKWKGADIMVFNSGHWWDLRGKMRAWEMFEFEGKVTEDMPIDVAYEHGLKTWATWIEKNVDPKKTKVVFRSNSPWHQYDQWCYNKTQPMLDEPYKQLFTKSLVNVVERQIKGMRKPQVIYLNITKLSEYRIDAHPSMYRYKDWNTLAQKYGNNLNNYVDCSHWCLPGVPDTWNRLLYASLFFDILANSPS
ncbi:protein trichome birefringence-like 40 [Chenopodium quinoa]|uniref:Trichome birefringence-like N-terminal domain-containing protein n=1 Tax=Chenopodium quinoa TaxID=63459 RepID=A0A803N1T3_CHEQI|nr:protein trichome birefringence-like 40 [Chenopodium quinoa]